MIIGRERNAFRSPSLYFPVFNVLAICLLTIQAAPSVFLVGTEFSTDYTLVYRS